MVARGESKSGRRYDVVLFGATGFTGRLVARRIAAGAAGRSLTWAIAGRRPDRLEAVAGTLAEEEAGGAIPDILVADVGDPETVAALARQTRVLCTTVGPYARYGTPVVEACVAAGTHYCDLTGETPWMRSIITRFHEEAERRRLRLVHTCGFDSIPSDLGVWMLEDYARTAHGGRCDEIRFGVAVARGGLSGGTVASMVGLLSRSGDPEVRRVLADPHALDPPGRSCGRDRRDQMGVEWDEVFGSWTAPFLMAGVNTRVVRRSNALLGCAYGRDFRYREVTLTGRGARGFARAAALALGLGGLAGALTLPPLAWLLGRTVLPAPGQGPSKERRARGAFRIELRGRLADCEARGQWIRGVVADDRDPGYDSTSVMLAEAALCLAGEGDRLPERFGVLTPATAFGDVLLEGLRRAGLRFEVGESEAGEG